MSDKWSKFLKLALGTGLMMMETNRAAKRARDRMGDWQDTARDRYGDIVDRVGRASDALSGRHDYFTPIGSFLLGLGVGAGLGLLFAPASGEETRSNLWDQASDFKERVAGRASDLRDRATERASEVSEQARETIRRETSSQPYSRPA